MQLKTMRYIHNLHTTLTDVRIGEKVVLAYRPDPTVTMRVSNEGSGQFRVKMHAKPQLIIFQSLRDAKILWFSCKVFDTLIGAS